MAVPVRVAISGVDRREGTAAAAAADITAEAAAAAIREAPVAKGAIRM
jgi:hypothetical protein